jgi:hypothetical protein
MAPGPDWNSKDMLMKRIDALERDSDALREVVKNISRTVSRQLDRLERLEDRRREGYKRTGTD